MNLKELGLLITEDIYVFRDEIQQRLLAEKISKNHGLEMIVSKPEAGDTETNLDLLKSDVVNPEEEKIQLEFEGDYQKGVLILFQGDELTESSREFLMKILSAVNHSLKDIGLLSERNLKGTTEEHLMRLNPLKMIVFGTIYHPVMGLKKENYHILQEEVECFFADELSEIENNLPLKKQLWSTLQRFFNIK